MAYYQRFFFFSLQHDWPKSYEGIRGDRNVAGGKQLSIRSRYYEITDRVLGTPFSAKRTRPFDSSCVKDALLDLPTDPKFANLLILFIIIYSLIRLLISVKRFTN